MALVTARFLMDPDGASTEIENAAPPLEEPRPDLHFHL
jgi:hypothetical protein